MLKLFVSLTLIIAASCWLPYAVEDHIIHLGEPTFWDARGQFGGHGLLVYFYDSHTCSDCKQFELEYKAVAASLSQNSIVNVSKVDCYVEKRFCFFEGLISYPSISLYTWNYKVEYTGPRTAAAIEKWVKKNVDSVYEDITTDEQLFKRFSTAILLSDSADDMTEISAAVKELSSEVEVAYASKNYRQGLGENGGIVTQGGLVEKLPDNAEQIKKRVREVNIANFGPRETLEMKWGVSRDYIFYFRTTKFSPKSESAKAFDKLVKDFGNRFGFYYVNVVDDVAGSTLAKRFGVQNDSDITIGIASQEGNIVKKYKKDQITTEASIRGMINDFLEHRLKRHYMSAAVPVKNPKDQVVELVGSTYSSVVHDPTKNVLVLLYTPDCQDCTRVELIFKALAYRYRDINNLVLAKMDATENEVDGFDFYAYPAVIFCEGKPDAKPTEYIYDKTMTGFKSFLEKSVPKIKDVEL